MSNIKKFIKNFKSPKGDKRKRFLREIERFNRHYSKEQGRNMEWNFGQKRWRGFTTYPTW